MEPKIFVPKQKFFPNNLNLEHFIKYRSERSDISIYAYRQRAEACKAKRWVESWGACACARKANRRMPSMALLNGVGISFLSWTTFPWLRTWPHCLATHSLDALDIRALYTHRDLCLRAEATMRTIQKLPISIAFSTQISINSLASGGGGAGARTPEPPTNAYF